MTNWEDRHYCVKATAQQWHKGFDCSSYNAFQAITPPCAPIVWWRYLMSVYRLLIDDWWEANDPKGYNFDCTDNYRLAIVGHAESEKEYETIRNTGCCGYHDIILELPDGRQLKYGFNYGH